MVAKYYPSSSGNSSHCPGRSNGVGTVCYPTTYYGQGGIITKNYFAFSVFKGDSSNNYIYFADRKSPYKVKKTISGNWGHMSSFYYSWDTNVFKVDEDNRCYSGVNGEKVGCKNEGAKAWSGMGHGLTWQGRAQFNGYVALAVWNCNCSDFGQKWGYRENENAVFIYKTNSQNIYKTLHIPKTVVNGEIEDVSFDSNGDLYIFYNGHNPYTLSFYKVKGSLISKDLGNVGEDKSGGEGGNGGNGGSGGGSGGSGGSSDVIKDQENRACTTLLPDAWCNGGTKGDGIFNMIKLAVNVMALGVTVLSTIGIIISGVMIVTARDNVGQVAAAKNRIYNIVIGLTLWGILAIGINLILPGGGEILHGLF